MGPIIDLTNLFPWRIIFLFAQSFAFFNIYKAVLKDKFHPLITFFAVFGVRIITSVVLYNNDALNSLGYFAYSLLCLVILIFFTDGKKHDKFLVATINLISQFTCAGISGIVTITAVQGKSYDEVFGTENYNLDFLTLYLFSCVLNIIIGILFSALLKLFKNKHKNNKNTKLLIYISMLPVSHILVVIVPLTFIPIELDKNYLESSVYIAMFILFAITIIFDCSFPFVINYFEKLIKKNNDYEKELLKNKMDYQQMQMIREEKQELRKIKHDFINITTTAKGLIEIGKPKKAISILNRTNENLMGVAGFSICSNETINTIIYIKTQQAKNGDVILETEIEENYTVLPDDYDFCRLLNNIIDNSINAANTSSSNKRCQIKININHEKIIIKSENSFTQDKQKRKNKNHGNGIGIIKEIAAKYGGKYLSRQENGIWYTETFLLNKNPSYSTPPRNLA